MGLTIGISVKRQHEGYGSEGNNPQGTREQIEEQVREHLSKAFPGEDGLPFALSVAMSEEKYSFDVSFARYGNDFLSKDYTFEQVYLALTAYILEHFSRSYGIDMHLYFSA